LRERAEIQLVVAVPYCAAAHVGGACDTGAFGNCEALDTFGAGSSNHGTFSAVRPAGEAAGP